MISFIEFCEKFASLCNRNTENTAEFIIKSLWDSDILDGEFKNKIIDITKTHLQNTIFHPYKFLEIMDLHGGQLSLYAIEVVRLLETNGDIGVTNTIIPHRGKIMRVSKVVEEYANDIVPYVMGKLEDGSKFAEFNPDQVVSLMIEAYGLTNEAKTSSIAIDIAIDSAQLSKRNHHTTLGAKMVDRRARHPKTGKIMCNVSKSKSKIDYQSRNHCFPTKIALQRETTRVMEQFQDHMSLYKDIATNNFSYYKPINLATDCNLSAAWKIIVYGRCLS